MEEALGSPAVGRIDVQRELHRAVFARRDGALLAQKEEVAPHVAQWDKDSYFPTELVPKMGDMGLYGLVVPEEYGGSAGHGGIFFANTLV